MLNAAFRAVPIPALIWRDVRAALRHAKQIERSGPGPGSLTQEGLRYEVVIGSDVRDHAPSLWHWAHRTGAALVSELLMAPVEVYGDPDVAVNINRLQGAGEKYELHVDSVPITGLWCLTSHERGGELVLAGQAIPTVRGLFLAFRGDLLPHQVMPLVDDQPRITVPISFKLKGTEDVARDPDLDAHLYAKAP